MWIAATGRNGKKLGLVSQAINGEAEFIPIEDLRAELPFGRSTSRRVRLQFNEHKAFSTEVYLSAVGVPTLAATGQRCYEFETVDGPVVIPGQILVVALVGTTTLMRAPLLSPQGPTALVTALHDAESNRVTVESTPRRMRQFQTDRWSAVCRMAWVLQFPSATRAWASVYANALDGLLDVTLPNAAATAILRGIEADGKFMVTGMDMLTLQATEKPHEFAMHSLQAGHTWSLIESAKPETEQSAVLDVGKRPANTG